MNDEIYTYADQLNDSQWKDKRLEILKRDNNTCQMCGSKSNLNIHHRYYIYNRRAWQYNNTALITLCNSCHKLVHKTVAPLIYAKVGDALKIMNFTPCNRCGGYGYLSEYKHVMGGICFRCQGLRYEELIDSSIKDYNQFIDYEQEVFDSLETPKSNEIMEEMFQKAKSYHFDNPDLAIKGYRELALLGYGKAQNNLGSLYEDQGKLDSAKRLFLYAAMQGISQAKRSMFFYLNEVEHSTNVCMEWLSFLKDDVDFYCIFAARFISSNIEKIHNGDFRPEYIETHINAIKLLLDFAAKGHEKSKIIVEAYQLDVLLDVFNQLLEEMKDFKDSDDEDNN